VRDFLGASFSASDDELVDEVGLAMPSAMEFKDGPGIAAVGWSMGSDPCDAMLQNEVRAVSFEPQTIDGSNGSGRPA
jgi:hypothetical protein